MIMIDKLRYNRQDIEQLCAQWAKRDGVQMPEGRLYAVCLRDALAVLTFVLYLRERGGSILLLPGDTPISDAREQAQRAGCYALITGDGTEVVILGGELTLDEPSLLQFSSGTTGQPKLIARSWQEIEQEISAYNQVLPGADVTPVVLVPLSHSYGLIAATLTALARGVEPVVVQSKNPKFALAVIREHPRSLVYGVPFLLQLLLAFPKEEVKFHRVITSGSPLPSPLLAKLRERSDVVMQQYGCSEGGCLTIGEHIGSPAYVGMALPHVELRVEGHVETPSEVHVRFRETGRRIATHDLGYLDELGGLHVLGRMDDLINVAGLKVMPSEVESCIARMSGVWEAVVYKTRHPVHGEAVKAMVVANEDVTVESVRAWCVQHLPPFKVPGTVELVDEIPKTAAGKVSRKLLQEQEVHG